MARKKKPEEHENLERWLVSYADFITLLFAFFVVMYSISQVNEGKYRVLTDSLISAFRTDPATLSPFQMGDPGISAGKISLNDSDRTGKTVSAIELQRMKQSQAAKAIERISQEVSQQMRPLINKGLISIRNDKDWVEIEINTSILFSSGSASLVVDAKPILRALARILNKFPNPLQVEGFTDNVPINTRVFPSNWELSAARAASVVSLFEASGIDPKRMAAIGYGEHRPVAPNTTAEGRNKNRRVVLVVNTSSETGGRQVVDTSARNVGTRQGNDTATNGETAITPGIPVSGGLQR